MIKITLNNYEALYLDYLEGNLPTEDVAALLLFLEQHPQLKVDFDSIENLVLSEDSISYSDKSLLKNFSRAEQLMIGSVEGINSKEESAELQELVSKSSVLSQNLAQFHKTKLKSVTIHYPNKNNLKRRKGIVVYLYPFVAVAATVAILITVFNFSFTTESINSNASTVADRKNYLNTSRFVLVNPLSDSIININTYNIAESNNKPFDQKNKNQKSIKSNLSTTEILNNDTDSLLSNDLDPKDNNFENKKIINIDTITPSPSTVDNTSKDVVAYNTKEKPSEITIRQFISNKIRKNVFKEEEPSFDNITGNEIMANVSSGLSQLTKKEVVYVQESAEQKEVVSFSVGKFEFYRSKTK
jgi:hypothetical protein